MEKMNELKCFNDLYAQYHKKFIRFANSYVRDIAVAEDYTIISFMKYWEKKSLLPPDHNAPAYILTTVKNKCLNYLQHQETGEKVSESIFNQAQWELSTRIATLQACEPHDLFKAEIKENVLKSLKKMPDTTRKIFLMSRYYDKSYKQIAEDFAMTTKGVEFHISKAMSVLRLSLKDYLPVLFYFFYSS